MWGIRQNRSDRFEIFLGGILMAEIQFLYRFSDKNDAAPRRPDALDHDQAAESSDAVPPASARTFRRL